MQTVGLRLSLSLALLLVAVVGSAAIGLFLPSLPTNPMLEETVDLLV